MKVSMNGLRIKLANAYNELARKYLDPWYEKKDMGNEIEDLRYLIGALSLCFEEGNPDFKEMTINLIDLDEEYEED